MVNTARRHFDWNVLVTSKRSDNRGPVGKLNHVLRVRREETLQDGYTAIEDGSAFSTSFGMHKHLVVLHEVGVNTLDVRI
jgi:hypothetical protein